LDFEICQWSKKDPRFQGRKGFQFVFQKCQQQVLQMSLVGEYVSHIQEVSGKHPKNRKRFKKFLKSKFCPFVKVSGPGSHFVEGIPLVD
jgi:hypothetical protein